MNLCRQAVHADEGECGYKDIHVWLGGGDFEDLIGVNIPTWVTKEEAGILARWFLTLSESY